jgi:hypothetical protein
MTFGLWDEQFAPHPSYPPVVSGYPSSLAQQRETEDTWKEDVTLYLNRCDARSVNWCHSECNEASG